MKWWEYDNSKPLYRDDSQDRGKDAFAIGFLLSGPALAVAVVVGFLLWLVSK